MTNSSFKSDVFSFSNYTRGSVDNRTGSYNFVLPLARLKGNNQMGPTIDLSLKYNYIFNKDSDEGFGAGWHLGLTKYIRGSSQSTLYLKDGRTIYLNEASNGTITINTVTLNDFKFTKNGDSQYKIEYKDGSKELLSSLPQVGQDGVFYLTKLTNEAGYGMYFSYERLGGDQCRLYQGRNANDNKADATGEGGEVLLSFDLDPNNGYVINMNLFPQQDNLKSTLSMTKNQYGYLSFCTTPDTKDLGNIYMFNYISKGDKNEFSLLSQVSNLGKYKEEITYNKQASLPANGPYKYFPAVSSYKFTMFAPEDNIYTERHDYEYTPNNFTGYTSGATWDSSDAVIDNSYLRNSNFNYGTTESLYVEEVLQLKKTQTYNKFHLLIHEEIDSLDGKLITHNYTYYADTATEYKDQVSQYTCLKKKETHYTDNTDLSYVKIYTEITDYEYDEYGNILKSLAPFRTKEYTYVDPPLGLNPFVRHISSIKEYNKDVNNSRVTEYNYKTLFKLGSPFTMTVIDKIKEAKVINGVKTYFRETDLDYIENVQYPIDYLPRLQKVFLSGKQVSTQAINYDNTVDGELKITTEITTTDNKTLKTIKSISTYTGLTTLDVDPTGVKTKYSYDSMGRILSITTGYGTGNAVTTNYSYNYSDDNKGIEMVKETHPDGIVKETYLDGFNNECLIKINNEVSTRKYYNTLNQLLLESVYDTNVSSTEQGEKINTISTNKYYYDKWGRNNKVEYSNGTVFHSDYNMIDSIATEYFDYGIPRNQSGNYAKHIVTYDTLGRIISEKYSVGKDVILKTINNIYDEFNNLVKQTITTKNSNFKPLIRQYTYDDFDRLIILKEGEDGSTNPRKISYEYSQYTDEPIKTSISVNDKVIGTRRYDGLNRLIEEKIGNNKAETYEYDEGYLQPKTMITSKNKEISYKYRNELNYVPDRVEVDNLKYIYSYDIQNKLVNRQDYMNTTNDVKTNTSSTYIPHYNSNHNIIGETFVMDGKTYSSNYERGNLGTINSIINPNGMKKIYGYNEKGQLIQVKEDSLTTTLSYINDFPNEVNFSLNNANIKCSFGYDELGRETVRTYRNTNAGQNFSGDIFIIYNEDGKISEKHIEYGPRSYAYYYDYDIFGRLISVNTDDDSSTFPKDQYSTNIKKFEYTYDDFDNIVSATTTFTDESTNTANFTYDSINPCKLLKVENSKSNYPKQINFQYDDAGNIISMGERKFDYDDFNKLYRVNSNSDSGSSYYKNDYNGNQYKHEYFAANGQKEVNNTTLYTGDKLFTSIDENMDSIRNVTYGLPYYTISEPSEDSSEIETYSFLVSDALGNKYGEISLGDITDNNYFYLYTPYGYSFYAQEDKIQYAGERLDSINNLYHLGNGERAYDPILMRFLQPDNLSPFDGGGINPYAYCLGDPINFTDPSGHISFSTTMSWVGIGLGAIGTIASSIATFGIAAAAAGGILAALNTIGGVVAATSIVLDLASVATGAASLAISGSDSETSNNLSIASLALGLGAFVTGTGVPAGMVTRSRMISSNRILSGTFDSIDYTIGDMNAFYTATFRPINPGLEPGSLVTSHGKYLKITSILEPEIPSIMYPGKLKTNFLDPYEFARQLQSLPGYSSEGPLYLISCSAGVGGNFSNAQKIANALQRPVYVFPNKLTYIAPNMRRITQGPFNLRRVNETLNFMGLPTFSKIKRFEPKLL
ncbi:RHS repeat-associated core domain-containing protein [Clostridium sp. Marseille-Q2269]|uniref:RHS repeat-associated core domain-containing protein n=1 Tax=Clostridium sp. Marseille-Q2269 TaxID=2942205 RepID=UPI0020734733|nr:RHS repeat-associated core domain-containing protein [Clostridium sp. Marseille-Q2269]